MRTNHLQVCVVGAGVGQSRCTRIDGVGVPAQLFSPMVRQPAVGFWIRSQRSIRNNRNARTARHSPNRARLIKKAPLSRGLLYQSASPPIQWNCIGALAFWFGRIFCDEPASTSSENALVAIVFGLIGTLLRDADVGCLLRRQLCQLCADLLEVQTRHLFIEVLGQRCYLVDRVFALIAFGP